MTSEAEILESLDGLFKVYAADRYTGETFGDFSVRQKWVTV